MSSRSRSAAGAMVPVDHLRAVAGPTRVGQGTAVEQSRAVAEVQAAVLVAQQMPRSVDRAEADMQRACSEYALASRAFYRYRRGGQQVSGPTIQLARELARCWGNIDYGIAELRRDDDAAQSEMKAWAWDQETNARPSSTFIVPHMRDKDSGPERLASLRDIYENNANAGARRLREQILAVLPVWYVEAAKALCVATLEAGDGRPLAERIERAVATFAELGVTEARLVARLGRPRHQWSARDLGELTVVATGIRSGEATIADEFPEDPDRVTLDELAATPASSPVITDTGMRVDIPAAVAGDLMLLNATLAGGPTDPDPPASTDPDAVTVDQLLAAVQTSGRVAAKAKPDAVVAALVAAAADLVGVHVFLPDELVADQAVAEELLAKLTPAAES